MSYFKALLLMAAVAVISMACGSAAENTAASGKNPANASKPVANSNAATTTAAPAKESIIALEKTGWEGWKNRDAKTFEDLLSDKYVGFSATGRTDKAASIKSNSTANCKVNSYSWTDEQMRMIGSDVAVLTFKADQDYTCDGKKGETPTWSSSVYLRDGDKWKNVFYAETKVTDPKSQPAKAKTGEAKAPDTKADDMTSAMMAVETKGWDAWKTRDVKGVEDVMAKDFMYFSGRGRVERADAIKTWSEPKCTGLGYTFLEPKAVQLAPDAALVTYKANVTGTCDGIGVAPTLWVASFDIKEGDAWKNAFYMDLPR